MKLTGVIVEKVSGLLRQWPFSIETPSLVPKNELFTTKIYDDHPRHFYMGVPSPPPPESRDFTENRRKPQTREYGDIQSKLHVRPPIVKNNFPKFQISSIQIIIAETSHKRPRLYSILVI